MCFLPVDGNNHRVQSETGDPDVVLLPDCPGVVRRNCRVLGVLGVIAVKIRLEEDVVD